jgi:hypothetical protein
MDSDAMERRRLALSKMDNAKFSWYHVRYTLLFFGKTDADRAIVVAGVGLYVLICANFLISF